jgi:hypothetical protein
MRCKERLIARLYGLVYPLEMSTVVDSTTLTLTHPRVESNWFDLGRQSSSLRLGWRVTGPLAASELADWEPKDSIVDNNT